MSAADFEAFKARCDKVIAKASGVGLTTEDFADADWMGLFEELGPECEDQAIIDTQAESDETFAELEALNR